MTEMKVLNAIAKARSIRRYKEDIQVTTEQLEYIVNSTRFVGSAGNRQTLRYMLVNDKETCDKIFEEISFAAKLKPEWNGPAEGERPNAYIVVMTDTEPTINTAIDMGLAAEAMLLTATQEGLGGCLFRSFDPAKLGEKLGKAPYMPALVISIGYPDEVVILQCARDYKCLDNPSYHRDMYGHHIVCKLPLDAIIIK